MKPKIEIYPELIRMLLSEIQNGLKYTRLLQSLWVLLMVFGLCSTIHAQSKRADKLFERWDYSKAVKLLEKHAKKHPDALVYYKVGECYRKMENYEKALEWYAKVDSLGKFQLTEFYFNYGQILRNNNRYDAAKRAFRQYAKLNPKDTLANFYSKACDLVSAERKWDEPISLTSVSTLNTSFSDFCPSLYKDGIVFASSRKTPNHDYMRYGWTGDYYLDIFYAKKDSSPATFRKPVQFDENMVDLRFHDGPANFTPNNDTIYISRTFRDLKGRKKKTLGINRVKIFYAKAGAFHWKGMTPFAYNNDSFSVAHPFITQDGSKLFFSSDMPGGYGDADIYMCRKQNGNWSAPENLGPSVNTVGREVYPFVDSAGNLYFSSDGYAGFGGLDICVASRSLSGAFQKVSVLKYPFNSTTNDFGLVFTKQGRTGFFTSNRFGGFGGDDIYYFNLDRDSVPGNLTTSIYTLGYRPYEELNQAKVRIEFVDEKSRNPVDSGIFWRVDVATQKYQESKFTRGSVTFTVSEKSMTRIHALCRFYDLFQDSIWIPDLPKDTQINILALLKRTPVKERIIIVNTPDKKVKGKNELAFFDFAKYNIRPDAAKQLDSVVMHMESYPDAVVEISAHTDSRGSEKYNQNLSELRAHSAMRYLISKGIEPTRIQAKGYGFSLLVNGCKKGIRCSEEEHQRNRRVEFWIKSSFR